jgi:hypothetical protein
MNVESRCPDGHLCENVFDRVFATASLKDRVAPKLVYIGSLNDSSPTGVTCKHGFSECRANIQQLCVKSHTPTWQAWWRFVQCENYSRDRIGDDSLAKDCSKLANVNWDTVEECIEGKEGPELLQASVRLAAKLQIKSVARLIRNTL